MGSNGRPAGGLVNRHVAEELVMAQAAENREVTAGVTIRPHAGQVDMRTLMTTLVVKLDMVNLGIAANTAVLEAILAQLGQLDQMPAIAERLAAAVAQLESIKLPPFLTRSK